MKIEDLQNEWSKDAVIDKTILGDESLKISQLHSKYYKIFIKERMVHRQLQNEYKKLYLDKYEFYTQGPTKEQHERGWVLPAKGIILKNEVDKYLEADDDLIQIAMRVDLQKEKVDFIVSILNNIHQRSFNIKNAIAWEQWTQGGI